MQLLDRVLLFWVTFVKSPPPSQQVSPGFGLMLSREALSSWFPPTCTIEVERAHAFENPSYILGRSSVPTHTPCSRSRNRPPGTGLLSRGELPAGVLQMDRFTYGTQIQEAWESSMERSSLQVAIAWYAMLIDCIFLFRFTEKNKTICSPHCLQVDPLSGLNFIFLGQTV